MNGTYDYGLWGLVAFHIGIFVLFGLSLLQPARRREWRSMGAPVLLASYAHLARKEEQELEARFGAAYRAYRERVPAFLPAWPYRVGA